MNFREYKAKLRAQGHGRLSAMEPVEGQIYRVGDLPPGSVVRPRNSVLGTEYVVGRTGLAMKWEQPIPGSEEWQMEYVGQLPPGEWMTDKMWSEVAATGAQGEVTEDMFAHPDPWMDNEPGTLTLPPPGQPWPRMAAHGLIPCPNCGGDIQHRSGNCRTCGGMGQRLDNIGLSGRPQYEHEPCPACHGSGRGDSWYECAGCRKTWDDTNQAVKEIMPGGIPCPKCGSDMYEQHNSPLYPNGAWECSNQRCWHMMGLGDVVPDAPPEDLGRQAAMNPPDLNQGENMFGPLDGEVRTRLNAVMANPTPETWDDAQGIILNNNGMGTTLWQAVIAVDPSFGQATGPVTQWVRDPGNPNGLGGYSEPVEGTGWSQIPSRDVLIQAIRYATG